MSGDLCGDLCGVLQIWENYQQLAELPQRFSACFKLGHNSTAEVFEKLSKMFLLENRIGTLTTELSQPAHLDLVKRLLPQVHWHTCVIDGTTNFSTRVLLEALAHDMSFKVYNSLDLSNLVEVANESQTFKRIKIILQIAHRGSNQNFGFESFVKTDAFNSTFTVVGIHLRCSDASEASNLVASGIEEFRQWTLASGQEELVRRKQVLKDFLQGSIMTIYLEGLNEPASRMAFVNLAEEMRKPRHVAVHFDVSEVLLGNAVCMLAPVRHVTDVRNDGGHSQSQSYDCILEFAPDPSDSLRHVMYLDGSPERLKYSSVGYRNAELLQTGAETRRLHCREGVKKSKELQAKLCEFSSATRRCICVALLIFQKAEIYEWFLENKKDIAEIPFSKEDIAGETKRSCSLQKSFHDRFSTEIDGLNWHKNQKMTKLLELLFKPAHKFAEMQICLELTRDAHKFAENVVGLSSMLTNMPPINPTYTGIACNATDQYSTQVVNYPDTQVTESRRVQSTPMMSSQQTAYRTCIERCCKSKPNASDEDQNALKVASALSDLPEPGLGMTSKWIDEAAVRLRLRYHF